jgi:hypothetical protein
MDEREVKEFVAGALQQVADDCEIRVARRGIVLEFMDGGRFLLPQPVDLGEVDDPEEDGEDDEDEGPDTEPTYWGDD